jgi:transposase-like protein
VAKVQGDDESKRRVAVIFSTMPATRTVEQACRELGIGPTHFDNLRTLALQGAVERIAPRPTGRPPLVTTLSPREIDDLQRKLYELERENELLRVQLEVAEVRLAKSQSTVVAARHRLQIAIPHGSASPRRRPRPTVP